MSLYRLHLRSGYPEAEAPAVEPLTNPADVGLGGVVFQDDGGALRVGRHAHTVNEAEALLPTYGCRGC